jgi:hypothetical protein
MPTLAATVLLMSLLLIHSVVWSAEESREALNRRWDGFMIRGEPAEWAAGERIPYVPKDSFEKARGSVTAARMTADGISVSDIRGTRIFGLIQGVGWHMFGGLLARQSVSGMTIELYGKEITRKRGGFLGLDSYHKLADVSYEFFLLRRPAAGGEAAILERWIIAPEGIAWHYPARPPGYPAYPGGVPGEAHARSDVRGFLEYDPGTKIATVTITGLTRPFKEHIAIADQ